MILRLSKIAVLVSLLLFSSQSFAKGKSVNIRVNPIGLLFGVANVGADFALGESFTLGAQVSFIDRSFGSDDFKATSYGLRAQYFFNGAFTDSWYFAGSADLLNAEASNSIDRVDVDGTTFAALAGYMWIWSNFNIQLGFGIQNISIEEDSTATTIDFDGINGTLFAAEFSLGWAF